MKNVTFNITKCIIQNIIKLYNLEMKLQKEKPTNNLLSERKVNL